MTAHLAAGSTRSRRTLVARSLLGALTLIGAAVGGSAQAAPTAFYRSFPGFGRHWLPHVRPGGVRGHRPHHLHVAAVTGPQSPYGRLGASPPAAYWTLLTIFAVVFASAAYVTVRRRAGREIR